MRFPGFRISFQMGQACTPLRGGAHQRADYGGLDDDGGAVQAEFS
jgi:hypothetical protein